MLFNIHLTVFGFNRYKRWCFDFFNFVINTFIAKFHYISLPPKRLYWNLAVYPVDDSCCSASQITHNTHANTNRRTSHPTTNQIPPSGEQNLNSTVAIFFAVLLLHFR